MMMVMLVLDSSCYQRYSTIKLLLFQNIERERRERNKISYLYLYNTMGVYPRNPYFSPKSSSYHHLILVYFWFVSPLPPPPTSQPPELALNYPAHLSPSLYTPTLRPSSQYRQLYRAILCTPVRNSLGGRQFSADQTRPREVGRSGVSGLMRKMFIKFRII